VKQVADERNLSFCEVRTFLQGRITSRFTVVSSISLQYVLEQASWYQCISAIGPFAGVVGPVHEVFVPISQSLLSLSLSSLSLSPLSLSPLSLLSLSLSSNLS